MSFARTGHQLLDSFYGIVQVVLLSLVSSVSSSTAPTQEHLSNAYCELRTWDREAVCILWERGNHPSAETRQGLIWPDFFGSPALLPPVDFGTLEAVSRILIIDILEPEDSGTAK